MNIDEQLDEILKAVFADGIYYDGNEIECEETPMSIDEARSVLKKMIVEARIDELYRLGMVGGVNIEVNEYLEKRIDELKEDRE